MIEIEAVPLYDPEFESAFENVPKASKLKRMASSLRSRIAKLSSEEQEAILAQGAASLEMIHGKIPEKQYQFFAKKIYGDEAGADHASGVVYAIIVIVIAAALIPTALVYLVNAMNNTTLKANSQMNQVLQLLPVIGIILVVGLVLVVWQMFKGHSRE